MNIDLENACGGMGKRGWGSTTILLQKRSFGT